MKNKAFIDIEKVPATAKVKEALPLQTIIVKTLLLIIMTKPMPLQLLCSKTQSRRHHNDCYQHGCNCIPQWLWKQKWLIPPLSSFRTFWWGTTIKFFSIQHQHQCSEQSERILCSKLMLPSRKINHNFWIKKSLRSLLFYFVLLICSLVLP